MQETATAEQRFERELRRDQELRMAVTIGSWTITLSTFAMIYILSIAFRRTSPFLMALPVYMVATRAVAFLSSKALRYPRLLLFLDDPNLGGAAQAVLERHRPAIVRPILKSLMRDADPPAVAALETTELVSLARRHDVERRRRAGRRWFAAWCVLSVVVWGALIATGAGPTD